MPQRTSPTYRIPRRIHPRRLCIVAGIATALAWSTGWAETLRFTATVNGATRVASMDLRDVGGVEYVSLLDLVSKLGGGFNLLFSRVQVEVGGKSAYIAFNDRSVEGVGNRFQLLRPLVRDNSDVLISRQDIPNLFGKGLQLAISDEDGPTASVPITRADTAPADPDRGVIPVNVGRRLDRQVKTIVIDAGHGGLDRGAVGRSLQESELTQAAARAARNALASAGYSVVLTREENTNRSIAERVKVANDAKGDLLVSLHAGASFAPNAHGIEIFYATLGTAPESEPGAAGQAHPYRDRSRRFAQILGDTVREQAQAEMRGVYGAHLRLHKAADMPGVLVEMGVLTNPADEAVLEKDAYRQSIAQAILNAVQRFNDESEAAP